MIRIFLTPAEHRHYHDLVNPPAVFKLAPSATDEQVREQKLAALCSVIGMDRPRERIGGERFEVFGSKKEGGQRWQ